MTSSRPTIAEIDDYTSGALAGDDALRFEEELFAEAAEGRAAELAFLEVLRRIAPWFSRRGGFVGGLTRAKLEELRSEPHVHYLELAVNQPVEIPEWPEGTQLVVYRIGVDLRGYDDVEVHLSSAEGTPLKVFRGTFYEKADGAIYGMCEEPLARSTFRKVHALARVEGTRDGRRETVAVLETRPV